MSSLIGDFNYMSWVVIPILIFAARLADVSLATMRHILVYKGHRRLVPLLAFVEVIIWLIAIRQVMQDLSNPVCFLAWAAGFAAGTYLGMFIEEKLALGYQLIRVIATGSATDLQARISSLNYGVTLVKAAGSRGSVDLLLVVSERKRLKQLVQFLGSLNPKPFYTIEDVRSVAMTPWPPRIPTPEPQING